MNACTVQLQPGTFRARHREFQQRVLVVCVRACVLTGSYTLQRIMHVTATVACTLSPQTPTNRRATQCVALLLTPCKTAWHSWHSCMQAPNSSLACLHRTTTTQQSSFTFTPWHSPSTVCLYALKWNKNKKSTGTWFYGAQHPPPPPRTKTLPLPSPPVNTPLST